MSETEPPAGLVGSTTDLCEALDRLDSAVQDVIAHGPETWSRMDESSRLQAVQKLERARKKLALADSSFISAHEADLPAGPQRRARALSEILNTTLRDAKTRLTGWSRTAERPDPWGPDPTAPHVEHMPHLTELVGEGLLDAAGVEKVDRQIRALPAAIQPEITRIADEPVADLARKQGPDILDSLRNFLLDLVGADEPYTEKDHRRMRSLTLGRQGVDGMTPIRGTLTPHLAASMQRFMADHAKTGDLLDEDAAAEDARTPEQRRHDALAAAVHAGYGPGRALNPGRGATTIVAVMPVEQLIARTGTALTDVGVHVPAATLLEDTDRLETCLQVLGVDGRTLCFGRSRRLGSLDQYLALVGEEGISSAPGTDSAPAHCHVHHIDGWSAGGATDLDNLTLVSPAMHARVDDSRTNPDRWWTVTAEDGTGRRVIWTPPVGEDPTRTAVHNDHPTVRRHPGAARRRLYRDQLRKRTGKKKPGSNGSKDKDTTTSGDPP